MKSVSGFADMAAFVAFRFWVIPFLLFFSMCCFLPLSESQSESFTCDPEDLQALREFSAGVKSGWSAGNSSSSCCDWVGVTCNATGASFRVTKLELPGRRLTGKLASSIGSLRELRTLNLSTNFLSGPLPESLFTLRKLEVLDLRQNDFSGQIPSNISLTEILVIDLTDNQLTGEIPSDICSSGSKLGALKMADNLLTGALPAGIGNCGLLQELCLGFNNLSGQLPAELFGLKMLTRLSLQDNRFTGVIDSGIGNLSTLVRLDVSQNMFRGNLPEVFGSLSKLQFLIVHSNGFNGAIPISVSNSPSVRVLNLRNNSFAGEIKLNCSAMKSLASLDLGSNRFTGFIPGNLPHCSKLTSINMARNSFSGGIPMGCFIYMVGVVVQMITGAGGNALGVIVAGRLIAGLGVGFESAIVILYMSEICPKKVRGALVAGYQFCITIGLLIAACVVYATEKRSDTGSYRIPIGLQFAWALILGGGLFFLPDSPRYFVKCGRLDEAADSLRRLRGHPAESEYVQNELAEIIANEEYERSVIPSNGFFDSWANCFKGSLWHQKSNLRRTILGTSLQMMQQWTGVNFIFYYSTPFLQSTGAISNTFLISLIFTLVNVCSTPISFYTVEKFGRRPLLVWGALGMLICQFLVAVIGVSVGFNHTHVINAAGDSLANNISAVNAQIAFIAIFIFFFASTWGPGAWIVIGEIFPLPIRSRGVGLSTASNWLWNTIIAVITPYMVGTQYGNLKSSVFFVWGGLCTAAFIYAYFLVPETKGLSLEQIDRMMEETTPRTSSKWVPHQTFSSAMGHEDGIEKAAVEDVERKGSGY